MQDYTLYITWQDGMTIDTLNISGPLDKIMDLVTDIKSRQWIIISVIIVQKGN